MFMLTFRLIFKTSKLKLNHSLVGSTHDEEIQNWWTCEKKTTKVDGAGNRSFVN